jgi:1-acyl-sn-glycerol-3-phosphate acyltransferase
MTIFGRVSSLLSYLFTLITWLTNRIYYKEIIVVNEGRLPRDTPFILYANHSNQLDDGGVLSTLYRS